jgi:hypothetical protein
MASTKVSVEDRFHAKVYRNPVSGCWHWTARLSDRGYARLSVGGKTMPAHRWSYERFTGPIPAGLVLDHLCRNRDCVNPAHLKACTIRENIMAPGSLSAAKRCSRATHCPQGHAYDLLNTHRTKLGKRVCLTCSRQRMRAAT